MKKILAAALSVLIGSLGLTVVDKTLESRVATLESEVVALREEVSGYHSIPEELEEDFISGVTLTYPPDIDIPTISPIPLNTIAPTKHYETGFSLEKTEDSQYKFLLQVFENGFVRYIPPNVNTTVALPTDTDSLGACNEYYLYLTESNATITKIDKSTEYVSNYDNDYSLVVTSYEQETTFVTITYNGYTDPSLAGRKIDFYTEVSYQNYWIFHRMGCFDNTIKEDGSFSFTEIYCFYDESLNTGNPLTYSVKSISIK